MYNIHPVWEISQNWKAVLNQCIQDCEMCGGEIKFDHLCCLHKDDGNTILQFPELLYCVIFQLL